MRKYAFKIKEVKADPDVVVDEHPGSDNYMDYDNLMVIARYAVKFIQLMNEDDDLPQWTSQKLAIARKNVEDAYNYVYNIKSGRPDKTGV